MNMFEELMDTIDLYVDDPQLREAMKQHARNWACDDDDCRIYMERLIAGERGRYIGDEPSEYIEMNAGDFVEMVQKMMTRH